MFLSGRNDSDQKASDSINNFTVHYPHVSQQMSENPTCFFFSISIAMLFPLQQHQKSNMRIFSLFIISYVCITCLSPRSQCDLENPLHDLLILLLSADISLNPGTPHNFQIDCLSWNVFDKKGSHFLHINVNSLLPKTEEIRFIAKKSKATLTGINKTKLDGTIFDAEIYIEGYSIV